MLTLDEYILKRKKEDELDEFNLEEKKANMDQSKSYVRDYFYKYLNPDKVQMKQKKQKRKIERYRKSLRKYDKDVQNFFVDIYEKYNKDVVRAIGNFLSKEEIFFLSYTDRKFRKYARNFAQYYKDRHSLTLNNEEIIIKYMKTYHQNTSKKEDVLFLMPEIDTWVADTFNRYGVNLWGFTYHYLDRFSENPSLWPATHKKNLECGFLQYDYKQSYNLFNIDMLYEEISHKSFINGKKKYLEIIMMYYWLHSIEGDENYWTEYFANVKRDFGLE